MRIVYDDRKATDFILLLDDIICDIKYSFGTRCLMEDDRIQAHLVKKYIDARLGTYYIGQTATHAHGIGNNNRYPVYYKGENELEECCYIHINQGLYGECYVYTTDWDSKRIGYTYEFHRNGISKTIEQ